jgi:general secretion pathway protein G
MVGNAERQNSSWELEHAPAHIGVASPQEDRMSRTRQEGFSLIELLIVVAIIGIIATIAVPQLLDAIDRGRQRRSMADMRNIATANGTYRVDEGVYADALGSIQTEGYMQVVPTTDAWANALQYAQTNAGNGYTLESFGSDGADGPAAPTPWVNDPYDPDLELTNGQFTQAPSGQ